MSPLPFPLPQGFSASAVMCGVKPGTTKLDLALLIADRPCSSAGVFTTNLVCGAPVQVSRSRLPRSSARGVVINSGNANACTGEQGRLDAAAMTSLVSELVGCQPEDIMVCSTGVIGRLLPMDRIATGIRAAHAELSPTPEAFHLVAKAMMTTDTVPKQSARGIKLSTGAARVSGVCKGAAMIAPNMATMLCAILTDVSITPEVANAVLRNSVEDSFNCIRIDGHESTSDSVLLFANGASGATLATDDDRAIFANAVQEVATDLALAIVKDAEGAHHFVQLDVTGTRSRAEAMTIARAVCDSPLVKTAICGADPNWGRIISAAGYAGVPLREEDMSLTINGFELYRAGTPLPFDAKAVSQSMRDNRDVFIVLSLTHGTERLRMWTSDLTKEYVELNADYTT